MGGIKRRHTGVFERTAVSVESVWTQLVRQSLSRLPLLQWTTDAAPLCSSVYFRLSLRLNLRFSSFLFTCFFSSFISSLIYVPFSDAKSPAWKRSRTSTKNGGFFFPFYDALVHFGERTDAGCVFGGKLMIASSGSLHAPHVEPYAQTVASDSCFVPDACLKEIHCFIVAFCRRYIC